MMEVSVLVERLDRNGYRATTLGLDVAAEGPTREAALDSLSRLLCDKFTAAELVRLEIPWAQKNHPWKPLIGRWNTTASRQANDELLQQLDDKESIAMRR